MKQWAKHKNIIKQILKTPHSIGLYIIRTFTKSFCTAVGSNEYFSNEYCAILGNLFNQDFNYYWKGIKIQCLYMYCSISKVIPHSSNLSLYWARLTLLNPMLGLHF